MRTALDSGAVRPHQPQPLAGFGTLLRFMARRDRVRAPVWIGAIVGLAAVSAGSIAGLYDTPEELAQYAELAQADVAFKALAGPGYGLDEATLAAVVMNEILVYTFLGISLMCVFLMIRHTRAEEETDRAELVRAASVGRLATLAAAGTWVGLVNTAVAAGLGLTLVAFDLPTTGSLAFGLAAWFTGLVFIGVAATTAQVASSARAATASAGAVVGVSFLLRAFGDLGTGWLTWLSPLGWAQSIRAFADERWWVLLPMALTAALSFSCGVILSARRDLGAGLFEQRPGPARASASLANPLAMATRLQRNALLGWTLGIGFIGFFFGFVSDLADQFLENEAIAEIYNQAGIGTPTEAFLSTTVLIVALIASGYTVSTVLRLRTEESAGRAGIVIAAPVSRRRWAGSYLTVSAAGTVAIMACAGLAIGVGSTVALGDTGLVLPTLGAALTAVPALLTLAGFTMALFGLNPRLATFAWVGVVVSGTVGLLAETLNLPQWFRNLSPFEHIPAMPAASFDIVPVIVLLGLAAGLIAVGMTAIGRRNIGS
ncbi:MAG: ABC transporter permease [Acidimicrobiales bacterium]